MQLRGYSGDATVIDFFETVDFVDFRATLYPAGHILGSAMIFIETSEGNLLYTGDYRTPPSPATEGFSIPEKVDVFVTEATFALPIYRWKPYEVLAGLLRDFANLSLEDGYTPVFLGYNLGKAQELMHLLAPLEWKIQIHGAGYAMCSVYEEEGIELGDYEPYDRTTCEGKILITTSSALNNGFASNVKRKKIAYCSGWASVEARRTQMNVDKMIPISDHLDFFELIELCKKLNPGKVYLTHSPNPEVVQFYLEKSGIESEAL